MTVPEIPTKQVALFGGALTAHVPQNFRDASDFREVPDTQEVYVSMTDDTDISIIIDILQRVNAADDAAAVATHWEDVGDAASKVFNRSPTVLPNLADKPAYRIVGTVTPRNPPADGPQPFTAILMTVVRLEQQTTDLVITVNVPHTTPEEINAEGSVSGPTYQGSLGGTKGPLLSAAMQVQEKLLASLRILDWNLFQPDPDADE